MTMKEYHNILLKETLRLADEYQTAHDGKELTEDDRLYCLREAAKNPEVRSAREVTNLTSVRVATGKIVREWVKINN